MIVSKIVKNIKCYINCISKGKTVIQENLHGVSIKTWNPFQRKQITLSKPHNLEREKRFLKKICIFSILHVKHEE